LGKEETLCSRTPIRLLAGMQMRLDIVVKFLETHLDGGGNQGESMGVLRHPIGLLITVLYSTAGSCGVTTQQERFDLLRFLPSAEFLRSPIMESLLVVDCERGPAPDWLAWRVDGVHGFAAVGAEFRVLGSLFEGKMKGVWVWDAGRNDVPSWWDTLWVWSVGERGVAPKWWLGHLEERAKKEPLDGVLVTYVPGIDYYIQESWFAKLEGRYLIRASSVELLREAIRARGPSMAQRVRDLRAPKEPRKDAWLVVVRDYKNAGRDDLRAPSSGDSNLEAESLVWDMVGNGGQCVVRSDDPEDVADWLRSLHFDVRRQGVKRDGVVTFEDGVLVPLTKHDKPLVVALLFGCNAFL
jgi:hypothetical protein